MADADGRMKFYIEEKTKTICIQTEAGREKFPRRQITVGFLLLYSLGYLVCTYQKQSDRIVFSIYMTKYCFTVLEFTRSRQSKAIYKKKKKNALVKMKKILTG